MWASSPQQSDVIIYTITAPAAAHAVSSSPDYSTYLWNFWIKSPAASQIHEIDATNKQ